MSEFLKQIERDWTSYHPLITSLHREGKENFSHVGLPKNTLEGWEYINLKELSGLALKKAGATKPGMLTEKVIRWGVTSSLEGIQLVFLNGFFCPSLSHIPPLPKGVILSSLCTALKESPEKVEPHLGNLSDFKKHPFVALANSFLEDGAFVFIPKGVLLKVPIILHYLSAGEGLTYSHPRNLLLFEEGSEACVLEIYEGLKEEAYLTNTVTEVHAAAGSHVQHYRLQDETKLAFHMAHLGICQEQDSQFTSLCFSFGACLARNDIDLLLNHHGAEGILNGLYLVGGKQFVDFHTSIDHAESHSSSIEHYKGILGGSAKGVFNGKIIVRPHAQKTFSDQSNRNLLLSKKATIHSKPTLEIFANDIKCTHGATIGQLDPAQLFYLRSRGIEEQLAKILLTKGFAGDLVENIKLKALREPLRKLILEKLTKDLFLPEVA